MKFLKFITAAVFALALVACEENNDGPIEKSPFEVEVNSNLVQIGVDRVYFLVTLDGVFVNPAELEVFDAKTNDIVTLKTTEVEIDGVMTAVPEWVPTKPETKSFWVSYKSYNNYKTPVTITAVDFAMPDPMEDTMPECVNFVKRAFFNQFTGTTCGNCPYAMAGFNIVANDAQYADRYINVGIHTYTTTDPMYPYGYENIATAYGVSGYPTICIDMQGSFGAGRDVESNAQNIKQVIDNSVRKGAKAGIAVNVASDEGNTFVARVSVKAAVTGEYKVGAWIVEDDIEADQANYGCNYDMNYNIHESVLRVADSRPNGANNYYGHSLGIIEEGKIKDHVFVLSLEKVNEFKDDWVKENCRLVVFVTTKDGNSWYVTNVVTNSIYSEPIEFEYAN